LIKIRYGRKLAKFGSKTILFKPKLTLSLLTSTSTQDVTVAVCQSGWVESFSIFRVWNFFLN